ncbi:MAG: glycosyltransferase family 4 protein [Planctomycetaceae bacterium]|nr:glycosyltransferase family 4 protein [Planctomycetaceae bacterium]
MQKPVFISWAPHCSRSDNIAARLGGESHLVYAPFWGSHVLTVLIKYAVQSVRTLRILWSKRPQVVFVMVPPVFACGPVWLYCLLSGGRYVIDAHSGAFLNPRFRYVQWLQRFFSRRAVATIVTNDYLRSVVEKWGANAVLVSDVPVEFAKANEVSLPDAFNVTVVSSFCADEPTDVFLRAAAQTPQIQFHVTGDVRDLKPEFHALKPANVRFTGFLSHADYAGQMLGSDAVMALTTRDHTMQRGAYEAIYQGIPVITSDFNLLRKSFPKGTVFVRADDAASIVDGIRRLQHDVDRYRREASELRLEKHARWDEVAIELRTLCGLTDEQGPVSAPQVVHA